MKNKHKRYKVSNTSEPQFQSFVRALSITPTSLKQKEYLTVKEFPNVPRYAIVDVLKGTETTVDTESASP